MDAACHVLRYVKAMLRYNILLRVGSNLQVYAYYGADWHHLAQCSLMGHLIILGGSQVSRNTKKHITISCSSAKAEYHSMAVTTSELILL